MQRTWRERVPGTLVFLFFLGLLLASAPGRGHYLTDDDHGFQLCLGLQVLYGKTPGVDTFNAYGPLVVYASALGQALSSRSLVGETVLCAALWALSLTLVFSLVARHASLASGVLATVMGFALLARFYKWYLWLWPLAALWALDRVLASRRESAKPVWLLGLVLGVGWLHRPDVGSLCVVASVVTLLIHRRGGLARLLLGAALPVGVWTVYLLAHDGPAAPLTFVRSTFMGGWMASSGMGTPFPRFDAGAPLGPASSRVLAYGLLVLAYVGWLVGGVRRQLSGRADARSRFLVATACIGLAVVHQALHRKDGQHLLQVSAPALVGGFVWGEGLLWSIRGRLLRPAVLARLALLVLAAGVGGSIARWGRVDLVVPELWPAARYRGLAHPLQGGARNPLLRPILRLRELTAEDEAVLFFPLWPQAYVFAGRRMSGMLHGYYSGVFDTPPWSDQNLAAIRKDLPAVVAVTPDFLGRPGPGAERYRRYRGSHRDVDDFVRERYRRVLYDDGRIVLLGPGEAKEKGGRSPGGDG